MGSNDLTFGVRLTADGKQLVGEVRASREEFDALGKSGKGAMDAISASSSKMASQYSGLNKTVKEHSAAVTETSGNVTKLLDRYDPLGAKLRQLQADFKALDNAAASGKIAGRDDARVDAVYAKIRQEMEGAGQASVNLGLNTQYARREMMMLGKEALTGDFSRMPQTFASLATHSELLPSLISPIGLAIAGVTAALAAGAYAWSHWETVAVESAEKTMDAIRKARGETKRIASMDNEARAAEIADVESLIKTYEAYASTITVNTTRFNWRDSAAQMALYNAEIEKNKTRLGELRATSDAAPAAQSIIDKALKLDRIRAKEDEIAWLDAANKKELVDTKQYLDARKVLEKELADIKKPKVDKTPKTRDYDHGWDVQDKIDSARQANRHKWEADQAREYENAVDESNKIIDKARTASAEYVGQLQFENSLLGQSAIGVQQLTEQRRLDQVSRKEVAALDRDRKFAARDTNPDVMNTYRAAREAILANAEAAKQGAAIEIKARYDAARAWDTGGVKAIDLYLDEVTNAAKQSERLVSDAFRAMDDAGVQFVRGQKISWASLTDTVINDLIRIQWQQSVTMPVARAMGGSGGIISVIGSALGFGGGNTAAGISASSLASFGPSSAASGMTDYVALAGARASGGPVGPNSLYRVNENGPELLNSGGNDYLMMGGAGGFITPLGGAPSAVSGNTPPSVVVQVINQSGQPVSAKQQGGPQFDGRDWVIGVVLEAANSNPGFRNALGLGY